jgi:hypothetical protein
MIYLFSFIVLAILTLLLGRASLYFLFYQQVKILFSRSKNISNQVFSYAQLNTLPEPVQKYFKHVLKDGHPYISYVRLRHGGQFKTALDKPWIDIVGEEYFTTEKPGFIWKGSTNMFTARDMYLEDKGRLVVSLLSVFNIVDGRGEQFNQGELLRWLSESVWFPTSLLPNERLTWSEIDEHTARLSFVYSSLALAFLVTFNSTGEIVKMETKRYMGEQQLETWIIKLSDYRDNYGIKIPTTCEALWRLVDGDHSYAKFNLRMIEYDKPVRFTGS